MQHKMKKVLIVIHDMRIGGAQKSLLSFLQCLMASEYGKKYDIHLMMTQPGGPFCEQFPEQVKMITPSPELRWMSAHLNAELFYKHFSWKGLLGELQWILGKNLRLFPKAWNSSQKMWENWKKLIPENSEYYDIAISYIDGCPNYYVMDKVQAAKKVLWIHNEYQKLGYDASFDEPYFEKCDKLITISDDCRSCLLREFPSQGEKIHVLENISSGEYVIERSKAEYPPEFHEVKEWKLLSVGRLNYQKGFDLAIAAAKMLRDMGLPFLWLIVGEGAERQTLQKMIDDDNLGGCIRLVGARKNPYSYMSACDLLIQPSRWEGKSVVLDEAKILCKPIVATNYTTVSASVEHGKSGWLVDMNPESIAEGILKLCRDEQLRMNLQSFLTAQPKGNETELKKYIDLMFETDVPGCSFEM